MKILAISIYLFFVALFFIITYYAIHREKKAWNNGICPICGHELDCCFGCDYAHKVVMGGSAIIVVIQLMFLIVNLYIENEKRKNICVNY